MTPFFIFFLAGTLAAADDSLSRAIAAYDHYHAREAIRLIDSLPSETAAGVEALHYRGLSLARLGSWDEAAAALQRAGDHAPADVEILLDLADAQGHVARAGGLLKAPIAARAALTTLQRAAGTAPSDARVHTGLFRFYMDAPAIVGGNRAKALEELRETERLDALLGDLTRAELAVDDHDDAGALAIYRELQGSHPGDHRAFYEFGRLSAISGLELPHGLESLRRCLAFPASPDGPDLPAVHFRMGDIDRRQRNIPEARAEYLECLRLDADFTAASRALDGLNAPKH